MKTRLYLCWLLFSITSCRDKVILADTSKNEADSFDNIVEKIQIARLEKSISPSTYGFEMMRLKINENLAKQPSLLEMWEDYMKRCLQTTLVNKRNLSYLGINNEYGAGTIFDKSNGNLINTLQEYSKYFGDFTMADVVKTDTGVSNCNTMVNNLSDIQADLGVALKAILSLDAKLSRVRIDTINVSVTKFKKQMLEMHYLDELYLKHDPHLDNFFKSLYNKKNILVTQAYIITDYIGSIKFNSKDTIGIGVKLDSLLLKYIAKADVGIKFHRDISGQVNAQFTGNKVVIGVLGKVKEPKE